MKNGRELPWKKRDDFGRIASTNQNEPRFEHDGGDRRDCAATASISKSWLCIIISSWNTFLDLQGGAGSNHKFEF